MMIQDLILKQLKYTKMRAEDITKVFENLGTIFASAKKGVSVEKKATINQFEQKFKNLFKSVDLNDPKSMAGANDKLKELEQLQKELQDGITNHK